jgi:uncharacterized protein YndB with AHSA1/START domain
LVAGKSAAVATNETTIEASPEAVFDVLMDATAYPEWVVGAKEVRAVDDNWPEPGSEFHHTLGAGPLEIKDSTKMLVADRPSFVKLEVRAGPAGDGIVEIRIEADGDKRSKVVIDEFPIEGTAKALDGPLEQGAIKIRNVEALRRLKRLVEDRSVS